MSKKEEAQEERDALELQEQMLQSFEAHIGKARKALTNASHHALEAFDEIDANDGLTDAGELPYDAALRAIEAADAALEAMRHAERRYYRVEVGGETLSKG